MRQNRAYNDAYIATATNHITNTASNAPHDDIFESRLHVCGAVAQRVERWTCDQQVVDLKSYSGQRLNFMETPWDFM